MFPKDQTLSPAEDVNRGLATSRDRHLRFSPKMKAKKWYRAVRGVAKDHLPSKSPQLTPGNANNDS